MRRIGSNPERPSSLITTLRSPTLHYVVQAVLMLSSYLCYTTLRTNTYDESECARIEAQGESPKELIGGEPIGNIRFTRSKDGTLSFEINGIVYRDSDSLAEGSSHPTSSIKSIVRSPGIESIPLWIDIRANIDRGQDLRLAGYPYEGSITIRIDRTELMRIQDEIRRQSNGHIPSHLKLSNISFTIIEPSFLSASTAVWSGVSRMFSTEAEQAKISPLKHDVVLVAITPAKH